MRQNFLKLDCSLLKSVFGWHPVWNFDKAMEKSVEWYKVWGRASGRNRCGDRRALQEITDRQIAGFFRLMCRRGTFMFDGKTEEEARKEILASVDEYCKKYHQPKPYKKGDRIHYAGRVYDSAEMCNLVNSGLEFWLTAGHYTEEFEKRFAEYLHVRYASVVNSGSSANLIAFMTLTSPLLGERRGKARR
jgi:hypothetical protein